MGSPVSSIQVADESPEPVNHRVNLLKVIESQRSQFFDDTSSVDVGTEDNAEFKPLTLANGPGPSQTNQAVEHQTSKIGNSESPNLNFAPSSNDPESQNKPPGKKRGRKR